MTELCLNVNVEQADSVQVRGIHKIVLCVLVLVLIESLVGLINELQQSYNFITQVAETPRGEDHKASYLLTKLIDLPKALSKSEKQGEMVVWHHQHNGHEFEQTLEDSEGQRSLACCSPWGCKELDMTEWLNNNKLK